MIISSPLYATLPLLPLRKPKPTLSSSLSISSCSRPSRISAHPEAMGSRRALDEREVSAVFEVEEKSEIPMPSDVSGGDDQTDKLLLQRPDTLSDSSLNGVTNISQQKIIIRNSYW